MKFKWKLIAVSSIFLVNSSFIYAEEQQEPKTSDMPQLTEEQTASPVDNLMLPTISELHLQAMAFGITADWNRMVKVQPRDYKAMKLPKRAFEVGKTLSSVAFIVLSGENEDAPPPKGIVQTSYDAISSLNPPKNIQVKLQKLRDQLEAGTLHGKKLRAEVDILLNEVINGMVEDEKTSQSLKDAGTLVLGTGYFKAMYLGTTTVAGYQNPTKDQLAMFKWGIIIDYFINYFKKKAAPEFKESVEVSNFVIALMKIKPRLDKTYEQLSKSDIQAVATILEPLFK
ncbi:hypothetical protein QUF74_12525 [Candidatus Halobeggiatoa sp. HSG11]|nr:hypothetical protein [Candidatus Halobeggiatoa sp. HSG11]